MKESDWIYTKLVQEPDRTWTVVTKPLGNPIDALARKAMRSKEQFDHLPKNEALKLGQEFEDWREYNETGRKIRSKK